MLYDETIVIWSMQIVNNGCHRRIKHVTLVENIKISSLFENRKFNPNVNSFLWNSIRIQKIYVHCTHRTSFHNANSETFWMRQFDNNKIEKKRGRKILTTQLILLFGVQFLWTDAVFIVISLVFFSLLFLFSFFCSLSADISQ